MLPRFKGVIYGSNLQWTFLSAPLKFEMEQLEWCEDISQGNLQLHQDILSMALSCYVWAVSGLSDRHMKEEDAKKGPMRLLPLTTLMLPPFFLCLLHVMSEVELC